MMPDTLAPRAIIGVMTPAMNSVVQPELELLRPVGVTNQMQRFRLGGSHISDDLAEEAEKLMDVNPAALAICLTTDAGPDGVAKLAARCDTLAARLGIPIFNASIALQNALQAVGARRIAVLTPFNAEVNRVVRTNIENGGFEAVAVRGTEAASLEAICETPLSRIRELVHELAASDCDAIAQVGTALPLIGLIEELERETGKTIIACNAAVYWQTLRAAGIRDAVPGYGHLLNEV